jgi:restriction alleviation protein, Lar family
MSTESMVAQALEPCPFCGGAAGIIHGIKREGEATFCRVYCGSCQVRQRADHPNRAEAIAAWNTRTAAQPEREAVFAVGVKPGDIPPSATVADPLTALTTPAPAVSTDEIVEPLARAAADDPEARRIAAKCGTVCFDDMDAETQEFWRCIARAILSRLRGEG